MSTPAFILAALCSTGGTIGFVRKGSIPSLAGGVGVGVLYALGGLRMKNNQQYGIELALLASIVLAGSSMPRAIRGGGKPLPTLLSLLSLYGLYTYGNLYRLRGSV